LNLAAVLWKSQSHQLSGKITFSISKELFVAGSKALDWKKLLHFPFDAMPFLLCDAPALSLQVNQPSEVEHLHPSSVLENCPLQLLRKCMNHHGSLS